MGWIESRTDSGGRVRHTAMYRDLRGNKRSAGTFTKKREAERAHQAAETRQSEGRGTDPRRGRQTFERYTLDTWFPIT